MHEALTPTLFTRHSRPLHALLIDDQAWFLAADLAALLGSRQTAERIVKRLVDDQQRSEWLFTPTGIKERLLIDESALYAILAKHRHPENESLRGWITQRVLPELRNSARTDHGTPRFGTMHWKASGIQVIHWQGKLWLALEDLPKVVRTDPLQPRPRPRPRPQA